MSTTTNLARSAWKRLSPDSPLDRVTKQVPLPPRGSGLVRTGVTAGATLLVLSAASAATSAIRRRVEGS